MSTTTTAPVSTSSSAGSQQPGPRGRTALIAVGAAVAGAAVVAGLAFGFGGFASATPGTPSPAPVVPAGTYSSGTNAHSGGSATHHVVPAPPAPSASIETLQRELGQLNYYEGPITGTMNTQTAQAITYLQRDAGLPQTGTMNAATQTALIHFLATGNNQMGGNTMAS